MKGGFKIIFSIASIAIIFLLINLFPFLVELFGRACTPNTKVKGITIYETEFDLAVGETYSLGYTVKPSNAINKTVMWTSNNSQIVSVDNGKISAKSEGTAIITATTVDGSYSATCTVCVVGENYFSDGLEFEDDYYENRSKGIYLDGYKVVDIGTCTDTDIFIPSTYNGKPVIRIGYNAFSGIKSINSVKIPSSVMFVEPMAFGECSNLISASMSNRLLSVAMDVFYGCANLKEIKISSLEAWSDIYFGYCSTPSYSVLNGATLYVNDEPVTELVVPSTVKEINSFAFSGGNFTKVTISEGVETIKGFAFSNCNNLTSITIPKTVNQIDDKAFYNCEKLIEVYNLSKLDETKYCEKVLNTYKSLNVPSGVKVTEDGYLIYDDYFTYLLLGYLGDKTELVLPEYIEDNSYAIYDYAFSYNKNVKSVVIPAGVTKIGRYAFYSNTALESVTIGENVESIGYGAFCYCTSLQKVEIVEPCALAQIDTVAFLGCYSLTSILIPSNAAKVGDSAFDFCDKLVEVYNLACVDYSAFPSALSIYEHIEAESKIITTDDGFELYVDVEKGIYKLLSYKGNKTEIVLPASISGNKYEIASFAFYGNKNITKITLPGAVTKIGRNAFSNCAVLTEIVFEDTANWYNTNQYLNWLNSNYGVYQDVSNPNDNASTFIKEKDYYWYKAK